MIRSRREDICKALAIILMVIGHAGCGKFAGSVIYLFHMPVFFLIAGYLSKPENFKSPRTVTHYILRKVKRLWIPYVVWTLIYCLLLVNFFRALGLYDVAPVVLNFDKILTSGIRIMCMLEGGWGFAGAFWFLSTMFWGLLFWSVLNYGLTLIHINRAWLRVTVAMLLCATAKKIGIPFQTYFGGANTFTALFLISVGSFVKEFSKPISLTNRKTDIAIGISIAILILLSRIGMVDVGRNEYSSIPFLTLASLTGWCLLTLVSTKIETTRFANGFVLIGQRSMSIMILHFAAFKLVTLAGHVFKGDAATTLSAFPTAYKGLGWFAAYVLVGVIVPLGLSLLYSRLKQLFFREFNKNIKNDYHAPVVI